MTFEQVERRCPQCTESYEEDFFSFDASNGKEKRTRRRVCMGCEQTTRDERKQRDRMLQKIRDTTSRHARKFGITRERLMHHYGWTVEKLKSDALEHYERKGCSYCEKAFLKGQTMNDLTLDIVDPTKEPFYSFNVKWICNACNRMKQLASPVVFAIRLAMWKRWHARQAILRAAPVLVRPPEPSEQWLPFLAPA